MGIKYAIIIISGFILELVLWYLFVNSATEQTLWTTVLGKVLAPVLTVWALHKQSRRCGGR